MIPKITRGRKPSIGIDWNTSSNGMIIDSALLFLAARIPTARLNSILRASAISILVHEKRMSRIMRKTLNCAVDLSSLLSLVVFFLRVDD